MAIEASPPFVDDDFPMIFPEKEAHSVRILCAKLISAPGAWAGCATSSAEFLLSAAALRG